MPDRERAHDALIESPAGPVYDGLAGRTRTQWVHLGDRDGSSRSVELFVSVNAATHPDVAARALAGELHRLPDGRDLALPFVYHDPAARKLVVVVPQALAHEELQAWAKVLAEVAADTAHPVPSYVRSAVCAVGLAALHRALAAPDIEPTDAELVEVAQPVAPGPGGPGSAGEWQEVGPDEARSLPAPPGAATAVIQIEDRDVESVRPDRGRRSTD